MIRGVVIDDDPAVYRLVKRAVDQHCPYVTVVAHATSVTEGLAVIGEHVPDLVFLDVLMEDGSGFDLMDHFFKPDFKVILMSGFDQYALKGYKFNAIDYLMKPIRENELVAAINKAADHIREELRGRGRAPDEDAGSVRNHRIILKTFDQIHIVNTSDIVHIEADRNYSTLYLEQGRKLVVSRSIKEFEQVLSEKGFHRIHKSHIININKVTVFNKPEGGTVVMNDGSVVPVASRKRDFLLDLLNHL